MSSSQAGHFQPCLRGWRARWVSGALLPNCWVYGLPPSQPLPAKLSHQQWHRAGRLLPELWGHMPMPGLHSPAGRLAPDPCPSWLWPHLWSFSAPPHHQGCYTVILNAFETYVYLAGALAIGVLAIEVSEGPHSCSSPEARHPHRVRGRHSPTACTPSLSPPPDPWLRTQWDPASGTTG